MSNMRLRKGDRVYIIAGKDKGKEGKILRRDVEKEKIVVENVNMITKNSKPSQKNPRGGQIKMEAPIHASNAMLVCPSCGKPTRIARAFLDNGSKVRVCKKCGEVIGKA
ncbi:50S ribosomal protein L24 [Synergistales bacterium]|nr:50S ribosomal protein L24 [Synergistales bacterium]GHV51468.1 50S ribosomal protein L24 [Synergistales bacterium]